MRRRDFVTLLGAAAGLPLAARAQQQMPMIGYLSARSSESDVAMLAAFRRGLNEGGYVEGRNVAIDYRFGENEPSLLPALAGELVARKVAVIAATGSTNPILAAKDATAAIPIVFTFGGDPVQAGFVASLNRPGGNITGVTFYASALVGKLMRLVHEIRPDAMVIALLQNPTDPLTGPERSDAREAARTLGVRLDVLNASTPSEINAALASLQGRAGALIMGATPYFNSRRQQIVVLAMRDGIPVVARNREFAAEGALVTYGNDAFDLYRRAGLYVGRILKGEKPADLPIDQATRFELVINLGTAKTLGLTIPADVLAIADEVIE